MTQMINLEIWSCYLRFSFQGPSFCLNPFSSRFFWPWKEWNIGLCIGQPSLNSSVSSALSAMELSLSEMFFVSASLVEPPVFGLVKTESSFSGHDEGSGRLYSHKRALPVI
jgi:hypothetical protein